MGSFSNYRRIGGDPLIGVGVATAYRLTSNDTHEAVENAVNIRTLQRFNCRCSLPRAQILNLQRVA